jgi:hypothetical protein
VIATSYALPFAFEAPVDSPWDGSRPVALAVYGAARLNPRHVPKLRECLGPFQALGEVGGLAGTAVAPWRSSCKEPTLAVHQGSAHVSFDPCTLDERATHCLVCLSLMLHDELPLERIILSVPGSAPRPLAHDPKLEDPYPGLWPQLPFPHHIEDSESEDRVLRAQFAVTLSDEQVTAAHRHLMGWGAAAEQGAFGNATIEPRSSTCIASNPVEHYRGELIWPLEKCRFHDAALNSLVAVCATIHHRIAGIVDLVIE